MERRTSTPQVVAQAGQAWLANLADAGAVAPAPMSLKLQRDGDRVTAEVGAAPGRWVGYWAVLEGWPPQPASPPAKTAATRWALDHLVVLYQPLREWQGAQHFPASLPPADPAHRVAWPSSSSPPRTCGRCGR